MAVPAVDRVLIGIDGIGAGGEQGSGTPGDCVGVEQVVVVEKGYELTSSLRECVVRRRADPAVGAAVVQPDACVTGRVTGEDLGHMAGRRGVVDEDQFPVGDGLR